MKCPGAVLKQDGRGQQESLKLAHGGHQETLSRGDAAERRGRLLVGRHGGIERAGQGRERLARLLDELEQLVHLFEDAGIRAGAAIGSASG